MTSPTRSREQYRREQEAFVSDHGGSTPQEIVFALLPNVCGVLLTTTTLGVLGRYVHRNVRVVVEFVLTVIPTVLCCTILSENVCGVCAAMIAVSALNMLLLWGGKGINVGLAGARPVVSKRPFLTNFRALTNIVTAICILAVDFRIFPRKFAKTEVFGYSLMDTGVGMFVLANALVAPEARDFAAVHRQAGFRETLARNTRDCFRSCVPLLVLGLGRFLAVEYTEYQRHVTEYGIHWNFFITLAVVKLFTSMITSTVSSKYSLLSGIWILGMHEYIMSVKGLKAWILSDGPRDDFLSANREGLISVPGYIGLYLVGVAVGRLIHSTYPNSQNTEYVLQYNYNSISVKLFGYEFAASYNESVLLCVKLSLISAQACIATLFCDSYFKVSRRLANAGYCMWILTLTTMLLTFLLFVEVVLDATNCAVGETPNESKTEKLRKNLRLNLKKYVESKRDDREGIVKTSLEIFDAVNYNGLFFFLLSNIMTGFINISLHTLYTKQMVALSILIAYMAVNIFLTLILYRLQIPIKL